jgi:hypothetical protein
MNGKFFELFRILGFRNMEVRNTDSNLVGEE